MGEQAPAAAPWDRQAGVARHCGGSSGGGGSATVSGPLQPVDATIQVGGQVVDGEPVVGTQGGQA